MGIETATLVSGIVRAARNSEAVNAQLHAAPARRATAGLGACPDIVRFEVALQEARESVHARDARCRPLGRADAPLHAMLVNRLHVLRDHAQLSRERLLRLMSALRLPPCTLADDSACFGMVAQALLQRVPPDEAAALGRRQLLLVVADLEQVYRALMRNVASELATWDLKTLRELSRRFFPEELRHTLSRDLVVSRLTAPLLSAPLACARALLGLRGAALVVELGASLLAAQGVWVALDRQLRRTSPGELRRIAEFYNASTANPVVTRILSAAAHNASMRQELTDWLLHRCTRDAGDPP